MEWQFRKTLQSFQMYKKSHEFRAEIEKGDFNVLKMCLREIEIILSEPKEKIMSKVLAMRFVRDIMILGREDVVQEVKRLVPHLLKICSHDLQSDDPNRGETMFHEHPSYLRAQKEEQRTEIDQLGSTYLILSLESIMHWAKWIPLDQTGQMTVYAKAYNQLIERGVSFPTTFHYYKQSDTQKFKNTYKVEFFTDSYYTSHVDISNSSSRVSHQSNQKLQNANQISVESEIFEKTSITTIAQIKEFLQGLYNTKQANPSANKRLQTVNKRLQQIYDQQFHDTKIFKNKQLKQLKAWVDKYFVQYSFYLNKKIDLKEFLRKVNTEEVQIDITQEESISVLKNQPKVVDSNVKMYKSPKKELLRAGPSSEELLKKQEYENKAKIFELKSQIDQKERQIQQLKITHEREKKQLTDDYERRMEFLKADIVVNNKDKDRPLVIELEFQNQQLKKKLNIIETQLLKANSVKEEQLGAQNHRLQVQITKLKMENQKLINIINEKNQKEYKAKLQNESLMSKSNKSHTQVFMQTNNSKKFNQDKISQLEGMITQKDQKIKKLQKAIRKTEDDLELFKTQLNTQRAKKDTKTSSYVKKIEYMETQNKQLKQKLHQLRKTIDVKDVQIIDLKEDLRRFQGKLKDINDKKSNVWSDAPSLASNKQANYLSPDRATSPKRDPYQQLLTNKKIRYNNYEDLYLELKPVSKESFLRLCRSAFKKKDILFKENEFEIGVISENLSDNRVSFLLHLTNIAEKQIQNIRIESLMAQGSFVSSLKYELNLQYIFCIQPQEQQKVQCIVTNTESPFLKDRAVITVSYEKNNIPYSHNIFLPFMIPKFLINTKPSKPPSNPRFIKEEMIIRYTKKMLPRPSYIKSYFENILERIEQKKYEVELYHRDTDLNIHVTFGFGQNETLTIEAIVLREKINEKQKYILQETLGFMEVAFRK